jgi:hypothetical protein
MTMTIARRVAGQRRELRANHSFFKSMSSRFPQRPRNYHHGRM